MNRNNVILLKEVCYRPEPVTNNSDKRYETNELYNQNPDTAPSHGYPFYYFDNRRMAILSTILITVAWLSFLLF